MKQAKPTLIHSLQKELDSGRDSAKPTNDAASSRKTRSSWGRVRDLFQSNCVISPKIHHCIVVDAGYLNEK